MQVNGLPSGTIAVGVDGSPASERALGFAIDQAVAEHRPLTLVHAVEAPDAVWLDQEGHDTRTGVEEMQTDSQQLLTAAHDEVARKAPGLTVHELLRVADPRDVLLAVAREAAMVVVGSRGRGPVRRLLLGSVSLAVTRHATCPVVVVRPGNGGLRRGVLAGADGTERTPPVLDFAFRQASMHHLPVTVLHAFGDVRATVSAPHLADDHEDEDLQEQRLVLSECVSGLREKYPDVPARTELARGLPDECLVRMGEGMNLVVVGSHHGGAAAEVLLGSVSASVVEHATCPVAVVPTGDRG